MRLEAVKGQVWKQLGWQLGWQLGRQLSRKVESQVWGRVWLQVERGHVWTLVVRQIAVRNEA